MLSAIILLAAMQAPHELHAFLTTPDPSYKVVKQSDDGARVEATLTSQRWQGADWHHSLTIDRPNHNVDTETVILLITGDRVDAADLPFSHELAKQSGLSVATLFDIPNQPLFEAREDELIALTFGKYLETNDPTWPLLFPMTKSAIRAMDAVQTLTKRRAKRFIVTGASKRGWTTWLVGASKDPRVKAIAPMLFDNLNFGPQLAHQLELWGKYSPMIAAYSESGLTEALESDAGKALAKMTDPYSYQAGATMPVLVVNGANDPYWTADALSIYADKLGTRATVLTMPNTGHSLSNPRLIPSLAAFASDVAKGKKPLRCTLRVRDGKAEIALHGAAASPLARLWYALSDDLNFADSQWVATPPRAWRPDLEIQLPLSDKHVAVFAEVAYGSPRRHTSSGIQILK